jgi:hypothetical protein
MSRYLSIARSATEPDEINEINEKTPTIEPFTCIASNVAEYEKNEENEKSLRTLSPVEADAIGLNSTLIWVRVSREEVEATAPAPGWDGTLPTACAWPALCGALGPCPRHRSGGPCRATRDGS